MQNVIDWMFENFKDSISIDASVIAESQRFALGDAIVLLMSASPDDSLDVELTKNEGEVTYQFDPRIQNEWARLEADILREITPADGTSQAHDLEKASPLEIRFPLKDFPLARIVYAPLRYSKTRSFLSLVAQDQQCWSLLASQGVDYPPSAPKRPGILVTHLVVVAETVAEVPLVIMAQRTARQGERVGFHKSGRWSVSLEEQVALSDGTLQGTATRALREELLGPRATEAAVKTIALFLERPILNLTGAAVCRTSMTFAGLTLEGRK